MAFLAAENENLQLDGRFAGGRLPEKLLLSVRTKSLNKNCCY